MSQEAEVQRGERFAFGRNWAQYLDRLDDSRISLAEASLRKWFDTDTLASRSFLDVGSGSGVFSLAARQLGAKVRSFDYDADSVACTTRLQAAHYPGDTHWTIQRGSVLDREFLGTLGTHDIVYSWGVLHHTGALYEALSNVVPLVAPGGALMIAIYNDQGWLSRYWTAVKRAYNRSRLARMALIAWHAPYLFGLRYLLRVLRGGAALERGMSLWYDMLDWLGGYPFEVARPEDILAFYRQRGFVLERLRTCYGRHGCNEYLFRRA